MKYFLFFFIAIYVLHFSTYSQTNASQKAKDLRQAANKMRIILQENNCPNADCIRQYISYFERIANKLDAGGEVNQKDMPPNCDYSCVIEGASNSGTTNALRSTNPSSNLQNSMADAYKFGNEMGDLAGQLFNKFTQSRNSNVVDEKAIAEEKEKRLKEEQQEKEQTKINLNNSIIDKGNKQADKKKADDRLKKMDDDDILQKELEKENEEVDDGNEAMHEVYSKEGVSLYVARKLIKTQTCTDVGFDKKTGKAYRYAVEYKIVNNHNTSILITDFFINFQDFPFTSKNDDCWGFCFPKGIEDIHLGVILSPGNVFKVGQTYHESIYEWTCVKNPPYAYAFRWKEWPPKLGKPILIFF